MKVLSFARRFSTTSPTKQRIARICFQPSTSSSTRWQCCHLASGIPPFGSNPQRAFHLRYALLRSIVTLDSSDGFAADNVESFAWEWRLSPLHLHVLLFSSASILLINYILFLSFDLLYLGLLLVIQLRGHPLHNKRTRRSGDGLWKLPLFVTSQSYETIISVKIVSNMSPYLSEQRFYWHITGINSCRGFC